ncbi:hypothetical protein ACVWW4_003437 [Bradyrhizobium sp. LB7.1]
MIEPDRGMERKLGGIPLETDRLRQGAAGVGLEFAEFFAVAQGEDDFAVRAQFGGHDVEQAGIDADNGDQG